MPRRSDDAGGVESAPGAPPGPGPIAVPAPSLREVLSGTARELSAAGVESAPVEAERLVAHALGISRAELALRSSDPMPPGVSRTLARSVARRCAGEPLQHIEGSVAFRDLLLVADRRALIPRPETEGLVDVVARWAGDRVRRARGAGEVRVVRRPGREAEPVPPLEAVLDVGTGSGAIALALLVEGVARTAVGLDRSAEALAQAEENRHRAGIPPERFELRPCGPDPWEAISPGERFDVVVSNPPYVRDAEIAALAPEVREHEPRGALSGGPDGLTVIRSVARGARERLAAGGALFLEIGADQGEAVRELLQASGEWRAVEILRDLAGRDRYVRALPR